MDAISSSNAAAGAGKSLPKSVGEPGRILLIELINLLGLFFTHSRNAKGARATAVLFDQIVGRLNILNKMPGYESGIILRRIGYDSAGMDEKPDYYFIFGNLSFRGSEAFASNGQHARGSHHLSSALEQALACFNDLGIYAFYLQLPGTSPEKIDQLRLALNILSRFRQAIGNNASITFRYFGRAMAIPLIRDSEGIPEPNLTLVAGLNGLSAVNMREIVKQAVAFCTLTSPQGDEGCTSQDYNKIFSVRSLRSQLIQPPVEVNNIPWMKDDAIPLTAVVGEAELAGGLQGLSESALAPTPGTPLSLDIGADRENGYDHSTPPGGIGKERGDGTALVTGQSLFGFDFETLDSEQFGRHISLATRFLYDLSAKNNYDGMGKLISSVRSRFEQLPAGILTQIEVQRQGLKIELQGRRLIIGLVHPQLLDLIAFMKEQVINQGRIDAVATYGIQLFDPDNPALADNFHVSQDDLSGLKMNLRACFDDKGVFSRKGFLANLEALSGYGSTPFEVLWCTLRQSIDAEERLVLINAIPLLIERMQKLEKVLNFLLVDIFQNPGQIDLSDRNALVLAILMLRTHNKERNIEIRSTPEEVLSVRKSLNPKTIEAAKQRLDINPLRIRNKFQTVRSALKSSATVDLSLESKDALGFHLLLALEREGLIFMALVGGETAHAVIRDALLFYGDPYSEIYHRQVRTPLLSDLMNHLRFVLKCITRLGKAQDLENLKALERSASRLMALDTDPGYTQNVRQTLKYVEPAIRAIQVQLR